MEAIIQQSIKLYLTTHSRSNKKLIPLHSYISKTISDKLKSNFTVHSLPQKEMVVAGRYNHKKVDICVKNTTTNIITGVGSVKFIMSNYKQNANNYFENCSGELLNLYKSAKTMYIMVVFEDIPYYDASHNIKSYHKMENKDLDKYKKLIEDNYLQSLIIIKISNGKYLQHPQKISKEDLDNMDYSQFRIVSSFPKSFEDSITEFASKM